MLAFFALLWSLPVSTAPLCAPIEKEAITARDLTAVDAVFAALPAELTIGYAPAPGRSRIFGVSELQALADAQGVRITPSREVCFQWPVAPVETSAALAAMQIEFPRAAIEIIELSRFPAPRGAVSFPRSGLQPAPADVMSWRGHVTYGKSRRFDIWARVRLKVTEERVIATDVLRPGEPINEQQLRTRVFEGPPSLQQFASSPSEIVGRVARTTILPGVAIETKALLRPPEIGRGDMVTVVVMNGASRISMEAMAAAPARQGEMVQLRNPASGKNFRARVSGPGQAVIVLGNQEQ